MYQVGPACYGSLSGAAFAAAAGNIGSVVAQGSASYVVDVSGVTDSSITYEFYPVGGGVPITVTSPFTALPCGLLTGADGLAMGWMVAGVWLAVMAVLFIKRALTDGNS